MASLLTRLSHVGRYGSSAWQSYNAALKSHPVRTNAATTGVLAFAADAAAQKLEHNDIHHPLDLKRSATLFTFGVVSTPIAVRWFGFLDSLFPAKPTVFVALKKIALNQAVWSPFINASFFAFITASKHGVNQTAVTKYNEKMQSDFVPTLFRALQFWGSANFINFMWLPPHFRLLYMNMVASTWTCYLSYVGYNEKAGEEGTSTEGVVDKSSKKGSFEPTSARLAIDAS